MSVELEMSEEMAESEKKNSGAPEIENHTRMADPSELLKGPRKHTSRQENTQFVKVTSGRSCLS